VVSRRGRCKTVCARGADRALLCGPSTSPLERMRKLFAPPYFSQRTRLLLTLGFVPIAALAIAAVHVRGGSASMSLVLFYAALVAIITGETRWASYEQTPVLYNVSVCMLVGFGTLFLFI